MSLRKVKLLRLAVGILLIVLTFISELSGNETVDEIVMAAIVISIAGLMYLSTQWKCPACKRILPLRHWSGEYCPHCGEYLFYEE